MSKKVRKERKPRQDFAMKLAEKLIGFGEIDDGALTDNSGRWVEVYYRGVHLVFSFDMKGEIITDIGLYKDKVEVTDQVKVWGFKKTS